MSQQLLISDANILIDMMAGGILEQMFLLDYTFAVPDVLFHEELKQRHPRLPEKGLKILELTEAAILDTVRLGVKHTQSGVSNNDYLALALARQEDCPLLTGDAALRQVSILEDIEVRGTLWLMEELIEAHVIGVERAALAYELMQADGSRLPWREVKAQIKKYREKGAAYKG